MAKKAIIFDLDETLRKLEFDGNYRVVLKVVLRPKINMLLSKLKKVKEEGIDVFIWTTAPKQSVQKYFIDYLPEEYKDLFQNIIARENKVQLESNSIEEKIYGRNTVNKPITALNDYNQLLLFDDNKQENYYLRRVFENDKTSPNKQVIFACYEYSAPKPNYMYAYKKIAEENSKITKKANDLFTKYLEDPGCELMVRKIEEFEKEDFSKGLTVDMNNEKMLDHLFGITDIEEEIDVIMYKNKDLWHKYHKYLEEYYNIIKQKQNELKDEER